MNSGDEDTIEPSQEETVDPFATLESESGPQPVPALPIRYDKLQRGDQIGDFRIQRLLGRGSFGAVYLARELTLDRKVAVKVVLPQGQHATASEGRSLAQLEHPSIVGVYGEAKDSASGCQLLWMQFVDGCDMATLIRQLWAAHPDGQWTEADLVDACEVQSQTSPGESKPGESKPGESKPGESKPGESKPGESKPRPSERKTIEAVCRIGYQLAEALAHAHDSGIVHRDIKPANILMSREGTPLLADFNLADRQNDLGSDRVGGTLAYMPPEQVALVLGRIRYIDARRADLYSLGMVLWELAHGRRPYSDAEEVLHSSGSQRLMDLMEIRESGPPERASGPMIGLEKILRRAMSPNPSDRFPSAHGMATALKGLEELQRARRESPVIEYWFPFVRKWLFWLILIVGLLPHFAGSVLQILYNNAWIKPDPTAFKKALLAYNIVVYPACVGWLAWKLFRFAAGYHRVVAREEVSRSQLRRLRGQLLKLPRQFTMVAVLGWFPGVYLFPLLLSLFGPDPSPDDRMHYATSFAIAGAIATTYSYAFVSYLVCVHGYRVCWQTGTHYRSRARYELQGMEKKIGRVSILAGVLPLAAAVLLLLEAPRVQPENAISLNRLVITLIVFGGIGLYLVTSGSFRLNRVIRALTLSQE
ncbi:MAG: serine/threonine-protein kinase [Planctomycetota bacterium]